MDHDAFLKLVGDSKIIGLDVDWYADQIEIGVAANPHRGSSFEDFLKEEGLYEEAKQSAIRSVTAYLVMESKRDIRAEMLKTSEDYKEYLSRMDIKDADT